MVDFPGPCNVFLFWFALLVDLGTYYRTQKIGRSTTAPVPPDPFKTPQISSNRDHKTLNSSTLWGVGSSVRLKEAFPCRTEAEMIVVGSRRADLGPRQARSHQLLLNPAWGHMYYTSIVPRVLKHTYICIYIYSFDAGVPPSAVSWCTWTSRPLMTYNWALTPLTS